MWKIVPTPFCVSKVISPPKCARMVEKDINKPSPVPFFPFVVIISLNSLFSTSLGRPPALSCIEMIIEESFCETRR